MSVTPALQEAEVNAATIDNSARTIREQLERVLQSLRSS